MTSTILLLALFIGGATFLFLNRRAARRPLTAPVTSPRRDGANDVYWEARLLAALRGNRAALERSVNARARRSPGMKRWQVMRLVYLEQTRRAPRG